MATKTITITQEAYDVLSSHKEEHDSFSRVIVREMKRKQNLLKYAGTLSDKQAEYMKRVVEESRRSFRREE